MVSLGQSEDKEYSRPSEESRGLPQVSERDLSGASLDGSPIRLPHQMEDSVVWGGNPDELDTEDQEFLMDHIRRGTKKTYGSGCLRFHDFCGERAIDPLTASPQFIVKFILHCQGLKLSYHVMKKGY